MADQRLAEAVRGDDDVLALGENVQGEDAVDGPRQSDDARDDHPGGPHTYPTRKGERAAGGDDSKR